MEKEGLAITNVGYIEENMDLFLGNNWGKAFLETGVELFLVTVSEETVTRPEPDLS